MPIAYCYKDDSHSSIETNQGISCEEIVDIFHELLKRILQAKYIDIFAAQMPSKKDIRLSLLSTNSLLYFELFNKDTLKLVFSWSISLTSELSNVATLDSAWIKIAEFLTTIPEPAEILVSHLAIKLHANSELNAFGQCSSVKSMYFLSNCNAISISVSYDERCLENINNNFMNALKSKDNVKTNQGQETIISSTSRNYEFHQTTTEKTVSFPAKKVVGSPMPSPTMRRRVLEISHLHVLSQRNIERLNGLESSSHITTGYSQIHSRVSSSSCSLMSQSPLKSSQLSTEYASKSQSAPYNSHSSSDENEVSNDTIFWSPPTELSNEDNHTRKLQLKRDTAIASTELFGPLVGSYEESILSGRMSTTPSKPIYHILNIGVIAKGKCKPSLRCPPHCSFSFPAYFYNLQDDDLITPYVGNIDLSSIPIAEPEKQNLKLKLKPNSIKSCLVENDATAFNSCNPKWSGVYRVPPVGQLQLIIKNQNSTAVKVFLVPYDLSDMPGMSKTFIRQKSYVTSLSTSTDSSSNTSRKDATSYNLNSSSNSISQKSPDCVSCPALPLCASLQSDSSFNLPNSTVSSSVVPSSSLQRGLSKYSQQDSKIGSLRCLRYAVHLQFISPRSKCIYLHRTIRVVFTPRAPDSCERLDTFSEGPEDPKYISISKSDLPQEVQKERVH